MVLVQHGFIEKNNVFQVSVVKPIQHYMKTIHHYVQNRGLCM